VYDDDRSGFGELQHAGLLGATDEHRVRLSLVDHDEQDDVHGPAELGRRRCHRGSLSGETRRRFGPHIDYQLNTNIYLSLRYTLTRATLHDAGIGGFDLISRGYYRLNTFNTFQFIETSIHGNAVNETSKSKLKK